MKLYGLIGYPLDHSFSKKYFTEKFEKEKIKACSYRNFPLENIEDFPLIIRNTSGLSGLNVTIPYKEKIVPFLHELDEVSESIGAVNTIKFTEPDGELHLKGFNSDAWGFERSLHPFLTPSVRKALILGTGGASKAVKYVLDSLGIEVLFVSRTKSKEAIISYEALNADILSSHHLIVNTTPLGTFPDTSRFPPIPYDALTSQHILYDLVYNPPITNFLARGAEKGAKTLNGWEMLKLQAEKSWEIWTS